MVSAKWLFTNHRNHLAMVAYFEDELKRLEAEKDEVIEGMTLARPPIDQRPNTSSGSSPTERIALHYDEEMNLTVQIAEFRRRQRANQHWLQLYKSVLSCFTEEEAWLIENYYVNGLSQTALSSITSGPVYGYSRSTISRHLKRIIVLANQIIGNRTHN